MEIKTKKIAVLGLGAVGLSLIKALSKAGAKVTGFGYENEEENRRVEAELKKIKVPTVFHAVEENALVEFDAIVLASFGGAYLEAFEFARKQGVPAYNDLDFIFPFLKGKIIGITGTCGKSTTIQLVQDMLTRQGFKVQSIGGEVVDWGRPILDSKDYDFCLMEVGSSRLERTERFKAHISVLLNIFPAHGDRHGGSLVRYVEAKGKIFSNQTPDDYLIFDADAGNIQELIRVKGAKAQLVKFSLKSQVSPPGIFHDRDDLVWVNAFQGEHRFNLSKTRALGLPTRMMNAMAAIAVAKLCGVEESNINKALQAFRPLPGRLRNIRKLDGVIFVDDAQSNNIGATIWALNSFSKPIIWIAGGDMVYGSRLNKLPNYIAGKVKKCVLVGGLAEEIGDLFKEKVPIIPVGNLSKAVEMANQIAEAGDIVLFSPACPPDIAEVSAGLERGNIFLKAVKALHRTPRTMMGRDFQRI